jgi:hypothetical protein
MFVKWLEEYEKPNFRAISRLIKKLWQIYEFTVPSSSGNLLLCYVTTSGQMVRPVKIRNIIFCLYGLPLL